MAKGGAACGREGGTGKERRGGDTVEGKNGVKTLLEGVVGCVYGWSKCVYKYTFFFFRLLNPSFELSPIGEYSKSFSKCDYLTD